MKKSFIIFDIRALWRLTLSPERQSARMSKITKGGLTRSGTWCLTALPIRQQWASKGLNNLQCFLPARRYASANLCKSNACLSVCPSVRLSHASIIVRKQKKASVMISSPAGSPKILVFWCQISFRHSKGFPRAGASNKGGVGKFGHFLALSINIVNTVADRAKVTIND